MGADHAGFTLKEKVKQELLRRGHRVQDVGAHSADPAVETLRVWLETGFAGGRHQRRFEKIAELERNRG